VRRLSARLRLAANAEADLMMPTIAAIMRRDIAGTAKPGITYQDLMNGTQLAIGFNPPANYYEIQSPWVELSPEYAAWKQRHFRAMRFKIFELTGALADKFESSAKTKLGGVKVVTRTPKFKTGIYNYHMDPDDLRQITTYRKILLDSITITIFPNLPKTMLALMSATRWQETLDARGVIENYMLEGDSDAIQKLINHQASYRPILLPAIQFWMFVRIPNAIFRVLKDYNTRANLREG
jgi:hypothetical protein